MKTLIGRVLLILSLLCLVSPFAEAQLDWNAVLNIQPFPSPYISNWENNPSIANLTIYNNSGQEHTVVVYLTLTKSNNDYIGTINSREIVIPSSPPPTILNSDEFLDWDSAEYDSDVYDFIIRTNRLPDGSYEACVRIEDENHAILVENVCAYFTILYPDPPMLVYPSDGDTLQTPYPLFQWTPVVLPPQFQLHYELKIAEVLEGQTPERALLSNIPHYENDNINIPSLQYPPTALAFEPAKTYAWQVSALDEYGYAVTSNNGQSEIWTFATADTTSPPPPPHYRQISGTINDIFGNNVAKAKVIYHQVKREFQGDTLAYIEVPDSDWVRSDGEGYYQFDHLSDSMFFDLRVTAAGYQTKHMYGLEPYWQGDIYNYDITLTPDHADLRGRIVQARIDTALEKVVVELWQNQVVYHEPEPGESGQEIEIVPRQISATLTDRDGYFGFSHITGESYYFIKAGGNRFYQIVSDTFTVVGGPLHDLGTYQLNPKFGTIQGTVTDSETGSLVSLADVFIYPDTGFNINQDPDNPGSPQPESPPLFGPDTTDFAGHFGFVEVPTTSYQQKSERYIVWVKARGYYDTFLPSRITEAHQHDTVEVALAPVRGVIQGTVTSSIDGSPVGDVRVELYTHEIESRYIEEQGGLYATAFTNPDGAYTFSGLDEGTYNGVLFIKDNYQELWIDGPIEVSNGQVITLDAILERPTGIISGIVSDDEGQPLFGVNVLSPDAPHISEYTQVDGSFLITDAPAGELRLSFYLPGFSEVVETLDVSIEDTNHVAVTMEGYHGSITIVVRDTVDNHPIANATVSLQGEDDRTTNNQGNVTFNRVPVGSKTLRITPPSGENDTLDYREKATNIEIANGPNEPLTIKLVRAGRISGTVVLAGSGSGIGGATVRIEGINGFSTTTGNSGHFLLRNVPANLNLTLTATKVGYRTGRVEDITITEGQHLQDVTIELEESPLTTVYGFQVEVDSLISLSGGNKRVIGALVNVPANPALSLSDPGFRFYFDSLVVNSSYQPTTDEFRLDISEAPVTVFGRLDAILKDTTGALLKARWLDSLNTGEIRADLVMDNAIPRWIPGAAWAEEKIQRNVAPAFWADGAYHGLEGQNFGLAVTGTTVSARFWGFALSIDYAQSRLDSEGFHYYGALSFEQLNTEIGIEDLNIRKNQDTGRLEFASVTVRTTPPIQIPLGLFTVVDSSASWSQAGFRADGAVIVQSLSRQFGFENLRVSPEGDFLSLVFTADAESGTINVLSAEFTINEIGFGTEDSTHVRYFQFSGSLNIPQLGEPIIFQNLKYTSEGDFTGIIQFNQEKTIGGIVTIQLQSIEFEEDNRGKFIFIQGGIAFDIPQLHVQVGNLRFYEDGSFNIERIEISFSAGPAEVAVSAEWSENIFSGGGSIIIQPAFNAGAQFRYGGPSDWWIKVSANTNIPIGAVTIVNVTGELGYQEGTWIFGFGGGFTAGNLEKALRMDIYLRVLATPEGPIINGNATVVAMSGMEIGQATVTLDFVHDRFTGNIQFGFERSGIEVQAQIDVDIKVHDYWYVGASATIDFFSLATLNSTLALANNYNGWMHELPVRYHPNNQTINGFHADVIFHQGSSGCCWSLSINTWAYLMVNWNGDLAAGIRFNMNGSFDLWIVGGSATVNLEAAIQSVDDCLSIHGGASATLKLWVGCCGSGSGCWRPCWAWIFPCGFTACFSLSIDVDYACNSGWDFAVNW